MEESFDLYKGIFWITDLEDIENNDLYFQIPCDLDGQIINNELDLNAKTGTTYNHEKTWSKLSSKITSNKPFDYYPRGRVEINHGKVIIYLSPHIATSKVKEWIIDKFNLNSLNGIKSIRMITDGSNHYKCFLDD